MEYPADTVVEQDIFPDEKFVSGTEAKASVQTVVAVATKKICADRTEFQTIAVTAGAVVRLVSRRGNNERARVKLRLVAGAVYVSTNQEAPSIVTLAVGSYAPNAMVMTVAGTEYVHESSDELYAYNADLVNDALVTVVEDSYFNEY